MNFVCFRSLEVLRNMINYFRGFSIKKTGLFSKLCGTLSFSK